ncbi:hypothetical protein SDJN02_25275, partial [Cucurbita argyrosperma subsp. argyrosperma]
MATILMPSILSWKKMTAKTGTMGKPKAPMALEKREETSKMRPTEPTENTCQLMAVQNNASWVRDSTRPYPAEAATVHTKPASSRLVK